MKSIHFLLAIVVFLSAASCTSQPKEVADAIYLNAKVYTVDESNEWAEALAVKDGKFLLAGSTKDVENLKGENTEVVDLGGQFVEQELPIFIAFS